MALIAALVLVLGSAVAADDHLSKRFSCGKDFLILPVTGGTSPLDEYGSLRIIRRTAILEARLFRDGSNADKDIDRKLVAGVYFKGTRGGVALVHLTPTATIPFLKCLADGGRW